MKQLYVNNAKTTLAAGISSTDITLQVVDASKLPIPGPNEYFLVTLEIGNQIEIVKVSSVAGTNLYLNSVADRGQEGTVAASFPSATRVEVRVTKGTLDLYSRAFLPLASVNQLVAPKDAYNTGYVCSSFDTEGNPAIAITKDDYLWRFLNYLSIQSLASTTTNTTTTVNFAGSNMVGTSLGKYLIQFTSGAYSGYVREVVSYTTTSITWSAALPGIPADGDTFEILQSNSSILLDTLSISDDAVIMALILGGE